MKISASIYSDKKRSIETVVQDLHDHHVDLLHVDCNDDLGVFKDIQLIREITSIPIDLHIITENPEKYYDLLRENPVEYLTFQYENLKAPLEIPSDITGKKGLAIITPTPISVFDAYKDFDFILIMATIPGQSGGVFDRVNFSKIRQFKRKYPSKSVHVDGGVNGEVSFILRNMGVSSSVSGSYLFAGPSIGNALMNLTKREIESHFVMEDFMIPLEESPVVYEKDLDLKKVLLEIEKGALGFTSILSETNELLGIISNADIRKAMLKVYPNLDQLNPKEMINQKPLTIQHNQTVDALLKLIKKSTFPIMYLPVVNEQNQAVGVINFVNLVKGEL